MSKTNSHTEILTVIEGSEPLGHALSEGDSTNHVQGTLGDYIGFSEFNSIIDSSRQDNMDKEEAPN